MKEVRAFLFLALCLGLMGTTFVVKEGGKEVGRYEENDGKTETVVLDNSAPAVTAAKPKKQALPAAKAVPSSASDPGFQLVQQLAASTKQRNDARREETERLVKEMEAY